MIALGDQRSYFECTAIVNPSYFARMMHVNTRYAEIKWELYLVCLVQVFNELMALMEIHAAKGYILELDSEAKGHRFDSCRARHL